MRRFLEQVENGSNVVTAASQLLWMERALEVRVDDDSLLRKGLQEDGLRERPDDFQGVLTATCMMFVCPSTLTLSADAAPNFKVFSTFFLLFYFTTTAVRNPVAELQNAPLLPKCDAAALASGSKVPLGVDLRSPIARLQSSGRFCCVCDAVGACSLWRRRLG